MADNKKRRLTAWEKIAIGIIVILIIVIVLLVFVDQLQDYLNIFLIGTTVANKLLIYLLIKEVKRMKKLYRVLMILGSLVGICATVRW